MTLDTIERRMTVAALTDDEILVELYQRGLWPPPLLEDITVGLGEHALTLYANERVATWRDRLHFFTPTTWAVLYILVERYPRGIGTEILSRAIWPHKDMSDALGSLRVYVADIRILMPRIIRSTPGRGTAHNVYSLDLSSREPYDTPRRRSYETSTLNTYIAPVETAIGTADAIFRK
jgi:hypothetical protein